MNDRPYAGWDGEQPAALATLPTPLTHLRDLEADLGHPDQPPNHDHPHGLVSRATAVIALVAEGLRDDGKVLAVLGHVEALRVLLLGLLGVSAPVSTKRLTREPTVDPPTLDTASDRFLRVDEVLEKTGLGRTTIWRMERDGDFPRRRQVGANSVAWLESEIVEWMASRPIPEAETGDDIP